MSSRRRLIENEFLGRAAIFTTIQNWFNSLASPVLLTESIFFEEVVLIVFLASLLLRLVMLLLKAEE